MTKTMVMCLYPNDDGGGGTPLKAYTHMPTFSGLALESEPESAYSSPESVDSRTDLMIVDQLPILNMFNI